MSYLAYDERPTKPLFRPRHPVVCTLDILGFVLSAFFLQQSRHLFTQLYLCSLILLYAGSILYHWLPYSLWARRIDHSMIFVVIAMTGLPYWDVIFASPFGISGQLFVLGIGVTGVGIKQVSLLPRGVSGTVYIFAALPITFSFLYEWSTVPHPWAILWLAGALLYLWQLLILSLKWFNVYPERLGYREAQHVVLLIATTLHSLIALRIVG